MRTWALPQVYHAGRQAQLLAYRVRATGRNGMAIPPGCYVVIRLTGADGHLRVIVGPFEPGEAQRLLETSGPHDLIDMLKQARETPNPHDTLH